MHYKDQLNNSLYFTATPKRIVSLVPSQTELLVDLGLEHYIVGVTKFCVHPSNIRKSKTVVGGTKSVHFDKIRALKPDIILCNKEENTLDMVEELRSIAQVHLSDIYTLDDSLELIAQYGQLFKVNAVSERLIKTIKDRNIAFKSSLKLTSKPRVAYFIWKRPWMVAASNTFIDHMLELNGFENVFNGRTRYPEIQLNELRLLDVDLILLSSEPYPFKDKDVAELSKEIDNPNVCIVDGEFFSWYGSRLLGAFEYFNDFHNELSSNEAFQK